MASSSSSAVEEEMMIYLKICKTVALKTRTSETIKNLKALILEQEQIHEDNQELFFADNRLKDDQRLVDYNIRKNSTLHLIMKDSFRMKVNVHIPRNKKIITVEAGEEDTIYSIKMKIQAKEAMEPDDYTVVYAGKVISDYRTLASLNLPREPTFHFIYSANVVLPVVVNVSGNEIKVEVNLLYTVQDVKAIVASMMNTQANSWGLFYGGKLLEDSKRLVFYEIEEHCALEMRAINIKVFVEFWDGPTITLDVQLLNTIREAKEQILRKAKMLEAIDCLELLHLGNVLVEHRNLAYYFLNKQHYVLEMRPITIHIFVKLWTGKTITLDVRLLNTILEVKEKILQKENVSKSIRGLRLGYEGKVLDDDHNIASYNIRKDSTLYLKHALDIYYNE